MASTAEQLVAARAEARPLADFPGTLPADLAGAYAIQDAALALVPGAPVGWKVAMIAPAFRERYTAERLVGPIAAGTVQTVADGGRVTARVFEGGFAAVEAEFVVRVTGTPPTEPGEWLGDTRAFASLHVGAEIASSPLATINAIGPGAVISDHGNNAGAIVGPQIPDARFGDWEGLISRTVVDGALVGEGSAARVPGGPFAAVAFLAAQLAGRGRTLAPGDVVLTGMTTGVHSVRIGQVARLEFPGIGTFEVDFSPCPDGKK
ncbi:2-keto-4-pentenoate hydratase [Ancylobacter terrae]|uniref:2-keto-4-pentenoate hydratase n=1 Tax=Ancylobacter sp. sgz301288 TaxID=3342077 RepID=UPI00385E66C5